MVSGPKVMGTLRAKCFLTRREKLGNARVGLGVRGEDAVKSGVVRRIRSIGV